MVGTLQAVSVLLLAGAVAGVGVLFSAPAPVVWATVSGRLLAGAVAMTAVNFIALALRGGWRAAVRFGVLAFAIGWLAEGLGLHGGWLFGGTYQYHPDVRPVLPGGVPLYIPLSWFVVCGLPVMLVRQWPAGKAGRFTGAAVGAILVSACDLALDPISVALGIWSWEAPGAYFGVPFGNFLGWWLVAAVILWAGGGITGLFRRPVPIRFDLAWGAANGLLLVMLGTVSWQRLGRILPVGLSLLILSPFLMRWYGGLWFNLRAWRDSRRAGVRVGSKPGPLTT